ncbi:MAG: phosphoribosyltransferase family protein, partial [Thermomicrobiales bacterium]
AASRYFRPDFYLPDERMYIELTTMRQPLVTRKNRKLRLVRELYPSLRIKLLYRRDLERLRAAWESAALAPQRGLGEVVFSEREITARARSLACQIADEWLREGLITEPAPVVLAANEGAHRVSVLLRRELEAIGIHAAHDQMHRNRFRSGSETRQIRISRPRPLDLAGRRVLLVEDAVSTGLSASAATDWLARQGSAEWRICSLLDRRPARLLDIPLEWVAFDAPDQPLAGFGLTLHRQFRDLPAIFNAVD